MGDVVATVVFFCTLELVPWIMLLRHQRTVRKGGREGGGVPLKGEVRSSDAHSRCCFSVCPSITSPQVTRMAAAYSRGPSASLLRGSLSATNSNSFRRRLLSLAPGSLAAGIAAGGMYGTGATPQSSARTPSSSSSFYSPPLSANAGSSSSSSSAMSLGGRGGYRENSNASLGSTSIRGSVTELMVVSGGSVVPSPAATAAAAAVAAMHAQNAGSALFAPAGGSRSHSSSNASLGDAPPSPFSPASRSPRQPAHLHHTHGVIHSISGPGTTLQGIDEAAATGFGSPPLQRANNAGEGGGGGGGSWLSGTVLRLLSRRTGVASGSSTALTSPESAALLLDSGSPRRPLSAGSNSSAGSPERSLALLPLTSSSSSAALTTPVKSLQPKTKRKKKRVVDANVELSSPVVLSATSGGNSTGRGGGDTASGATVSAKSGSSSIGGGRARSNGPGGVVSVEMSVADPAAKLRKFSDAVSDGADDD